MKKRLFFVTLMVALFVCIFAISVSAESIVANTITSETYGTIYQLSADPGLDNADQYKSTLNNINDAGTDTDALCILHDGTYYYVFPSSYIVWEITGNQAGKFETYVGTDTNAGINNAITEWNTAEGTSLPTFTLNGSWGGRNIVELVRFEFPTDVTKVDRDHCCLQSPNLVEVRLHENIYLGRARNLFKNCTKLTTVVGLDKLANADMTDSDYFNGCTSLVSVKLPTNITTIGTNWFNGCTSFTGVENWDAIKGNLTSIGSYAFYNCTSMTKIDIPTSVTVVNEGAFQGCSNIALNIDFSKLTTIGKKAFYGITTITGELDISSATTIGDEAFKNCTGITSIKFSNSLTTIGSSAFYGCTGLTAITIPDSVTSLGGSCFSSCSNLVTVNISENSNISNKWCNVFQSCSSLESIYIPPKITELGYDNFWDCTSLKQVIFSEGLTTISGGNNFNNCNSLTKLEYPNSLVTLAGGNICHSIKEIRFGNSLTSIGDGNLTSKALERVYIPASLVTIDDGHLLGYSNSADSSTNITFIFTGTKEQAEALQEGYETWLLANKADHAPNGEKLYNATLVSADEYDADATTPSGYHFVYGYNVCKAFYNDEHVLSEENAVIDFASTDYFTAYNKCIACTRKGCDVTDVEEIAGAIFTSKGYSKNGDSIVFGIMVNNAELTKYNEYRKSQDANATDIKYGVVVSKVQNNGDLIKVDGTVQNDNVLCAEFSATSYSLLQIKITNISSDSYETELHCCAFVADGTSTTYLYEENGAAAAGTAANSISYSDITTTT